MLVHYLIVELSRPMVEQEVLLLVVLLIMLVGPVVLEVLLLPQP